MDSKITLAFDEAVIKKAKKYAEEHNISLSRLVEFLLKNVTASSHKSLEEYPIAEWVHQLAEGTVEYQTRRARKSAKKDFFDSRK